MADLQQTVERVEEELNGKRAIEGNPYDLEVGEHHDGPTIDVTKNGEAPNKVVGTIFDAAFDADYIVSGVNRHTAQSFGGPHTRLFLRPVEVVSSSDDTIESASDDADEEKFDHDDENAELGGAMAGMLFALMALSVNDDDSEDRAAMVAPYSSGRKPEYLYNHNARHSVIDNNHFVWDFVGTDTAEKIDDDLATFRTDERTEGHYSHVNSAMLLDNEVDGDDEDERLFEGETAGTVVEVNVDGNEVLRSMAGVETAEQAVEWISENGGIAHVSSRSGWEGHPYAYTGFVNEIPDGWERSDENENYLVKK